MALCLPEKPLCFSYLHKSGVAEMCHSPPYRNMPEEADAEEFKDEDVFHVAIMADEDHFAYI